MINGNSSYWTSIIEGLKSIKVGLVISYRHFVLAIKKPKRKPIGVAHKDYFKQDEGIVTLQYPTESIPVPDNGRYRLHNEIEDCIVCDKCAKICPVNCIDITAIKSSSEIRKASDGSSIRLYAETFDIDMAKCMFCGLCTTVCPTECLTMTNTYDFPEYSLDSLNYQYSDLTPEQANQKKEEYEVFKAQKKQRSTERPATTKSAATAKPAIGKPKVVTKTSKDESTSTKPIVKPAVPGIKKPNIPGAKPKIPIKKVDDKKNESLKNGDRMKVS